ncbi:uncharacterized protein METZ01_LOCUS6640 [marine metagenome]|uniref:Uncharacterized protein n=1 Tax=marine metagenome TaxID=408172 RepID=A0A381NGT3_9ZZZZ
MSRSKLTVTYDSPFIEALPQQRKKVA